VTNTQPAIAFKDVTKTYGSFHALRGLNLVIAPGQLYGLIGPNGAGKTTSIRLLTGLQKASSGTISVLGHAPQDPELRPLVGYMPQETALYTDLTVRENLALFGKLYGLNGRPLADRIGELLTFVELTKWADTVAADLSGGMRHRASLAAAMLPNPKLLVLDEPTVGVDPELRANFWKHFADMQAAGTTILITTHYMDEASRCERVGLINHGRLIAEDAPAALVKRTKSKTLEEAFLALARRQGDENEG
jgi:ABC-2 type transport system ATP-binding protein